MAGVKPSRQEVYLTCSGTDADLSWPATVPGDNNGCSKGLRSNSATGSLTPRQNQSPCRPHHNNRFIQPGAPREWELSRRVVLAGDQEGRDLEPDIRLVLQVFQGLQHGAE